MSETSKNDIIERIASLATGSSDIFDYRDMTPAKIANFSQGAARRLGFSIKCTPDYGGLRITKTGNMRATRIGAMMDTMRDGHVVRVTHTPEMLALVMKQAKIRSVAEKLDIDVDVVDGLIQIVKIDIANPMPGTWTPTEVTIDYLEGLQAIAAAREPEDS